LPHTAIPFLGPNSWHHLAIAGPFFLLHNANRKGTENCLHTQNICALLNFRYLHNNNNNSSSSNLLWLKRQKNHHRHVHEITHSK